MDLERPIFLTFQPLSQRLTQPTAIRSEFQRRSCCVRSWLADEALKRFGAKEAIDLLCWGSLARDQYIPGADIDLLFLIDRHKKSVHELIEKYLYWLWDFKLDVGYAIRTCAEAVRTASSPIESYTSMLDLRFVYGNKMRASGLIGEIWKKALSPGARLYVQKQLKSDRRRHAKAGSSPGLLEPHIRDGRGWIRDYQSATWMMTSLWQNSAPSEIKALRRQTEPLFWQALYLKYLMGYCGEGRRGILTFDLQRIVAHDEPFSAPKNMDYDDSDFSAVRKVMSRVHEIPRSIERYYSAVERRVFRTRASEVIIGRGKAAIASAIRKLRVDPTPGKTMANLFRSGKLTTLFPEFRRIERMTQFELSHLYTIDYHTIEALLSLDGFLSMPRKEAWISRMIREAAGARLVLSLAVLFHDIGKGSKKNHVEAGERITRLFASRLFRWDLLSMEECEELCFLVRNHLILSNSMQKRNTEDRFLGEHLAGFIKSERRLALLALVTVADLLGTNPELWNVWRNELFRKLYENIEAALTKAPDHNLALLVEARKKQLGDSLLKEFRADRSLVRKYIEGLPESYYQSQFDASKAAVGFSVVREVMKTNAPALSLISESRGGPQTIVIGAPDAKGLFARMVGTMSYFNYSVLSATVVTRTDSLVVDSFEVTGANSTGMAPEGVEHWPEFAQAVRKWCESVGAEFVCDDGFQRDVEERLQERRRLSPKRPSSVRSDVSVYGGFEKSRTIIDITAPDRAGLLYDISSLLANEGCGIHFARINTVRGVAYDSFYVSDIRSGERLDSESCMRVRRRLKEILVKNDGAS